MRLTYRAQTFNVTPGTQQRICQPYAINWRYQISTKTTVSLCGEAPQRPTAVNWRYQLPELQ